MNDMCNRLLETLGVSKLDEVQVRMLNPLSLAYIGDAVHEMFVRTYVISKYSGSINKLNKMVVSMIKATAQAEAIRKLESQLSEEELAIYKRGRNAKSLTVPKNTSVGVYRSATGFEALLGYLYLTGQEDRLIQLVAEAVKAAEGLEQENTNCPD